MSYLPPSGIVQESGLSATTPPTGSSLVGDNDTYTNFTPTATTVKGALLGIDTVLSSVATTSFSDNIFNIYSFTDNTKKIYFSAVNVPTATSRTITMASSDVDLGTLVNSQSANLFFASPSGSAGSPVFRAIVSADIPTLNQNTTGTAANITASSNSTLTTLSALSLPGSQVTGNITGNAANITASSNSTLTTLSSLSLPGSQVTGNISGNAANVTGIVAILNGGTGQSTASAAFNALSPITSTGDLIVGTGTNTAGRIGIGSTGQVLTVSGGTATWSTPATSGTVTSVSVVSANGLAGTVATATTTPAITLSTTVTGVIKGDGTAISAAVAGTDYVIPSGSITGTAANITASSNSTLTTLSALTTASSLSSVGTITSGTWNATTIAIANGGTGQTSSSSAYNALSPMTTTGDIEYEVSSGTAGRLAIGTTGQILTVAGGVPSWAAAPATGVTSVAMTVPAFLSVSGSPITSTGTLAVTLSGTALPVVNGGTGETSLTAYSVITGGTTSTGALQSVSGVGTSGQVLTSNGASTLPTWQSIVSGVSSVNGNTGAVTVNAINQLTGDVTTSAASQSQSEATTVAKIQGTTVSGTTGTTNVVFSDSPTLVTPTIGAATGTSLTLSGLTAGEAVVTNGSKALTSLVYTNLNTASTIASRDINGNLNAVSFIPTSINTATTQTITMTSGSAQYQTASASAAVTWNLPIATNLFYGQAYYFQNDGTATCIINENDGITQVTTVPAGGFIEAICVNNSTADGVWTYSASLSVGATSGTSGTLVPGSMTANTLISTVSTGTAPLTVTSTTQVANLNAATAGNVTGTVAIANGGTGQTTQQDAINALTGTQTSGEYLRSNGTNATLSAIQAADVPTLNQNTTGTAANITATSNTTITSLANLVTVGSISSGTWGGSTVSVSHGGTGHTNFGSNALLYGNGSSSLNSLAGTGSTGQVLIGATANPPVFSYSLQLGNSSSGGSLVMFGGGGGGGVTISADTSSATYNFNLPDTAGIAGQFLTSEGGGSNVMAWTTPFTNPMTTIGDMIYGGSGGTPTDLSIGTTGQVLTVVGGIPAWAAAASAGVTSVAMTVPAFLSVSGSPITSTGTLAVTLSGTALPIANGGTGQTTAAAAYNALSPMTTTGDIEYESATNVASRLAIGSTGQVLTVAGGVPTWANAAASGANTALSNLASVAVNTALLPGTDNSIGFGSASKSWTTANIHTLIDGSSDTSVDVYNRTLNDTAGNSQMSWTTSGVTIGVPNTRGGVLGIANGGNNASVFIKANNVATNWNFNLPTTAGTAGQVLTSQGGATNDMTWATPASSGVTSFAKSGGTAITGAVTISSDSSLALMESGQNVLIGASPEYAGGATTASTTVNFSNGTSESFTLSVATTTFTFSNPINGTTHFLRLVQDATGGRVVTWPTVKWAGGAKPTLSTAANAIDIISFYYDGTSYYGTFGLNFQ